MAKRTKDSAKREPPNFDQDYTRESTLLAWLISGFTERGDGTFLRQAKGLIPILDRDYSLFEESELAQTVIDKAVWYWAGYPFLLNIMGFPESKRSDAQLIYKATHALDRTHDAAAIVLMKWAGQHDLDPEPIWKATRLCRELHHKDFWKYYPIGHQTDFWPESLGGELLELQSEDRKQIQAADATILRMTDVRPEREAAKFRGKEPPLTPLQEPTAKQKRATRNQQIKTLCKTQNLNEQWVKLAATANEDPTIKQLGLRQITKHIARNVIVPPHLRRKK